MPDGKPWFNNRAQEKLKYRSVLSTGPGGRALHASRALHREVKAERGRREKQDLGCISLLRSMGGVLWGFWSRAGLVNSNQKNGVSGKTHWGLI